MWQNPSVFSGFAHKNISERCNRSRHLANRDIWNDLNHNCMLYCPHLLLQVLSCRLHLWNTLQLQHTHRFRHVLVEVCPFPSIRALGKKWGTQPSCVHFLQLELWGKDPSIHLETIWAIAIPIKPHSLQARFSFPPKNGDRKTGSCRKTTCLFFLHKIS